MYKTLISAALIASLSACSSLNTDNPSTTVQYTCGGNFSFSAVLDAKQATLRFPDQTLVLPRMEDIKGERYLSKDRKMLFLRKGENAVLATGAGHNILRCKQASKKQANNQGGGEGRLLPAAKVPPVTTLKPGFN